MRRLFVLESAWTRTRSARNDHDDYNFVRGLQTNLGSNLAYPKSSLTLRNRMTSPNAHLSHQLDQVELSDMSLFNYIDDGYFLRYRLGLH